MTGVCRVCGQDVPVKDNAAVRHASSQTTKGACAGSDLKPR